MTVLLTINESAMFYWALQYGPYVEVLEPESLRNKIAEAVAEMYQKYKEWVEWNLRNEIWTSVSIRCLMRSGD